MPSKQLPIFATQCDLVAIAQEICSERAIDFAEMGLFDQEKPTVLTSLKNLKPFTAYLVFNKGLGISVRSVLQRNGGVKYAVDPLENPKTMVLRCGGLLNGERLVAGDISIASGSKDGEELYALFSRGIRCKFEKIKSYHVGPEAARLLDQGLRLTPTAKSPTSYDLVR